MDNGKHSHTYQSKSALTFEFCSKQTPKLLHIKTTTTLNTKCTVSE